MGFIREWAFKKSLAMRPDVDVNSYGPDGLAPLHRLIGRNWKSAAEALIDRGADVNAKDRQFGLTPLHLAASQGLTAMVEMLLSRGAHIEATDDITAVTPLRVAADAGKTEVVQLLLARGANPNARDIEGDTALAWALTKGYTDVANLLRQAGGIE